MNGYSTGGSAAATTMASAQTGTSHVDAELCEHCKRGTLGLNGDPKWCCYCGAKLQGAPALWNETSERRQFEDAAYAHYLRKRAARAAEGLAVANDGPEPATREEMFARHEQGDYVAVVYQAAWGGWKMARGGMR